MPKATKCPACQGKGEYKESDYMLTTCRRCGGTGKLVKQTTEQGTKHPAREIEIEYNRWELLCSEAQAVGLDPNQKKFNRLFRAIAVWGESLVAMRVKQTQTQRERAASLALERYKQTNPTSPQPKDKPV